MQRSLFLLMVACFAVASCSGYSGGVTGAGGAGGTGGTTTCPCPGGDCTLAVLNQELAMPSYLGVSRRAVPSRWEDLVDFGYVQDGCGRRVVYLPDGDGPGYAYAFSPDTGTLIGAYVFNDIPFGGCSMSSYRWGDNSFFTEDMLGGVTCPDKVDCSPSGDYTVYANWTCERDAGTDAGGTTALSPLDAAANSCDNPLPLQCGDRLNHSTLIQGRANVWDGYNCTQRAESGREAIYAFQTTAACQVAVQLKNLTVDLDLFVLTGCSPGRYDKCSSTPLDLQTIETVNFTSETGQPYFVVVDGYNDAAGTYTLQVDCACNPDAGTSDAPRTDASGDSAVAPGCDLDVAAKAIAASGVTVVGSPQTLNVTLPTSMATDDNWGLKEIKCQQGGYDIAPLGGKTVCLVEQGSTQLCQGAPSNVWVLMNDGAVACIYKALRPPAILAPGLYSVTDPNCS